MSGGGDDGDNFLSNPVKAVEGYFNDWKEDPTGMAAEHLSGGLYDRKKGGLNLKNGPVYKFWDEVIGETNGRNAGRYGARQEQKAIDAEKVARSRQNDLNWLDAYRRDLQASRSAEGAMRSASTPAGRSTANQKLGDTGEEILGV